MECGCYSSNIEATRDGILRAYAGGHRDFRNIDLQNIDLSNCDLSGANFSGSLLGNANFSGSRLISTSFLDSRLNEASFSRAILRGADFGHAVLTGAELIGADLSGASARAANFAGALLIRAKLGDGDFLGANFSEINGTAIYFDSANLECADFSRAILMSGSFCGTRCSWSNFSDARMNWTNLAWALFEAADLECANMTGAVLRGANLGFSDMRGAVMTGADCHFTNLSGAHVDWDPRCAARLSSARLSLRTYERSGWTREQLREWQDRGAVIIDFSDFPESVRAYIKHGACSLKIYFDRPVTSEQESALELLIHLTAPETIRILSVGKGSERAEARGSVAFRASDPKYVEPFLKNFNTAVWHTMPNFRYEESSGPSHLPEHVRNFDAPTQLDLLLTHVRHIDAMVPIEDKSSLEVYQSVSGGSDDSDECERLSWSNVSLGAIR